MSGCLHFLFWFCASHYRAFHGVFQTTTVLSKDVYFGNQWSNHIITWEWMNFASVEQWSSKKSGVLHQNKTPVLQQILHIFILLSDFIHFTCDAHLSLFFFFQFHIWYYCTLWCCTLQWVGKNRVNVGQRNRMCWGRLWAGCDGSYLKWCV